MTRAKIKHNVECVDSRFVTSLNATIDDWYAWSGVWAIILSPYGGDRTDAQQQRINPGQTFSDHLISSAALARAAADIDNWRAIILAGAKRHSLTYEQAKAKYYTIAAAHGWKNQQTNGRPFPTEGWHLAKHSYDPTGIPGSALLITEEDTMFLLYNSKTNQAIYRPGHPLTRITELEAAPWARVLKQLDEVPDKATLDQARKKLDNDAWNRLVGLEGIDR